VVAAARTFILHATRAIPWTTGHQVRQSGRRGEWSCTNRPFSAPAISSRLITLPHQSSNSNRFSPRSTTPASAKSQSPRGAATHMSNACLECIHGVSIVEEGASSCQFALFVAAPAEEPHQTRWPEEPLLPVRQSSRSLFASTDVEPGFVASPLQLRLLRRSTAGGARPNTT